MKLGIAKHDIMRHCNKQTEIWKGDLVEILRTDIFGSDLLIRKVDTNCNTLIVFPEYIEVLVNPKDE